MCPPTSLIHPNSHIQHPKPAAGDFVPETTTSNAAYSLASSLLSPAILNHSIRVYLYAITLAQRTNSIYFQDASKHDLLFTACILHDIGTVDEYNGSQRFEVEGADAAVALLREHGISDEDARLVWMAIALHTSPGIAERIDELARLVREGVLIDFGRDVGRLGDGRRGDLKERLEGNYPRLGIEKALGDAVVRQAVEDPGKAPAASWPNSLYKAFLAEPEWEGVNKCF